MLDNITKKNIDDCRDVLVGKVPDPKSQIEQITLALIYKFMDDMDKEAVEKFKGKAKFFAPPKYTGIKEDDDKLIDYSQYSWRKLFDPSLSGASMLALYSAALEKLQTNPNMPELFRNIFKNAYLPYRDPSTLKLFLKYINEFEYSHSEKLGDAFEYLLSVMGSQGDAGQFRTPRHIIDFVTACVNPKKNETVLDPACGTAGFLLSAYKHILKQNTDIRTGDKLKPDDRKNLSTNFVGYDISPDMVRLSLANMYLHGFTTPLIHEYDSLSSEDRWQETFDVILANPPFMTPKGGIRPHKKFGVQANKAEVLFTDYIAEHLNPKGRAGIVVPNGIVATSQTAYKQLRKMLVQDSLIAVISLPAGVFQPYSGVKTSVLILDKGLAKKSQHILFLKIVNDGFDLGAQRREIDRNDLPLALAFLETFKNCLNQSGQDLQDIQDLQIAYEQNPVNPKIDKIQIQTTATLVEKETVLSNKDVVLSAERYFENIKSLSTEYEFMRLDDICEINPKKSELNDISDNLLVSFVPMADLNENNVNFISKTSKKLAEVKNGYTYFKDNDVLLAKVTPCFENGKAGIAKSLTNGIGFGSSEFYVIRSGERVLPMWIYLNVVTEKFREEGRAQMSGTSGLQRIPKEFIGSFEIPLPPISIQQQIVAEIEGYQKIIDGAKQVVNNYKPTITINPDWEMVELGTLAKIKGGYAFKSDEFVDSGIQVLKISNVKTGRLDLEKNAAFMPLERKNEFAKYVIKAGDILITMTGTEGKRDYGDVCLVANKEEYLLNQRVGKVELNSQEVSREYLALAMMSPIYQDEIFRKATGVRQSNVSGTDLEEITIPIPPIEEQQTIVKAIEEEMQLVNSNKRLIEIFEQKIKSKINAVWGVKEEEILSIEVEL